MKERSSKIGALIVLPPLIFLVVFYFYPLTSIFGLSFFPEGDFDALRLKKLFATNYYVKTLWFTTWQAALSTVLTLGAALPGAYVFARFKFPGKRLVHSLTAIPFVLPTVVVAAAFRALLGTHGLVNTLFAEKLQILPRIDVDQTLWFFLMAHIFYNYTLVVRIVGGFWSSLQPDIAEAARMLGASGRQVFLKITAPLIMPAISAAALLIFIFCFTSFGVILILGGPRYATVEVEIYRQAVHMFNLPMAAALSVIQILFTFMLMWVYTWIGRKTSVSLTPASRSATERPARSFKDRMLVYGNLAFMSILLGAPLLALIVRSFSTDDGFSLKYYVALFSHKAQSIFYAAPFEAVRNSIVFAGGAMFMAVFLGFFAATYLSGKKTRMAGVLDPLFMLPLSTSAVTLGFGFIIALNKPPLDLRTSIWLTPIAHALVAFPFVVRSLLPSLRSIPSSLREAAALLGASPLKVWRHVDLPIVGRAIAVGAVFAFSVSLGEFGATAFTARPNAPTMPVAIFRFLGQPGAMNYGQAMAMSSLLMLVTAAGFLFLDKFRIGDIGEF